MSFDATDIVPVEYQSLFKIISPIEKSGILKIIKEQYSELEDNYEALFRGLKDYLLNYKTDDISSLSFIMFGQICIDLTKNNEIPLMLETYPNSPELKFYNVQLQVDKGIFDGIEEIIANSRMKDDKRNMVLNRLVAADKLADVIMDLQSFTLENMYLAMKQQFDKLPEVLEKAEAVWKRSVEWSKAKDVVFVLELGARLIIQKTQILMSAQDLDSAIVYYEEPIIQDIVKQCKSTVMKANVLHVASMLYYSAGQPTKGLKHMEKAVSLLKEVHGRYSWKSTFYHNLAYMYNLIDTDKAIEAYETCLELLKDTEDLQSIADVLSNLIGIHNQANRKGEARKCLKELVEIIDTSEELITPFRAYAISANAMSLDDYELAKKYLAILDEQVEKTPTLMNQAIAASAKFGYYLDMEINSTLAYKYGEESLYYFNKQKDYLNALASVYNLVNTDFQFYKITEKERYLNSAKKRLNELLTLVGALDQPEWIADKNLALAGFEILSQNFDLAQKFIEDIPSSSDEITTKVKMVSQLLDFTRIAYEENIDEKPEYSEPLLQEVATNKDATKVMVMHMTERILEQLVQLPQQVDPIKADVKLILLINSAGLTIFTKIFDVQKMNQQLISNFISAIDSFGKQLFGTKEPYFSIARGNNIILFQNVNEDLNLALIVTQENYDAIMKLNTLSKELADHLLDKDLELNKTLDDSSDLSKWLEEKIKELVN
ncbi:MAG: tetratricopeptide repeat protein [Asgard group archaeon]|nr:tetratricopeptide repeat protein [Asgard group archaeon]